VAGRDKNLGLRPAHRCYLRRPIISLVNHGISNLGTYALKVLLQFSQYETCSPAGDSTLASEG
jgi:hypothetical protein